MHTNAIPFHHGDAIFPPDAPAASFRYGSAFQATPAKPKREPMGAAKRLCTFLPSTPLRTRILMRLQNARTPLVRVALVLNGCEWHDRDHVRIEWRRMERDGLLKEVRINIGNKGRKVRVLELTEAGRAVKVTA